jgi:hypothetical protein
MKSPTYQVAYKNDSDSYFHGGRVFAHKGHAIFSAKRLVSSGACDFAEVRETGTHSIVWESE